MAESWPDTLPQTPLMDGNGISDVSNRVEFSPDVGPPMRRQRTTLAQSVIGWNFNLTEAQRSTFKTFYDSTLAGGSATFMATDPFTGQWAELLFEGQYSMTKMAQDVFRLTSSVRRVS